MLYYINRKINVQCTITMYNILPNIITSFILYKEITNPKNYDKWIQRSYHLIYRLGKLFPYNNISYVTSI